MMFKILSKPGCPYCERAKSLIDMLGFGYDETIHATSEEIAEFKAKGFLTFPQIYRNDFLIGGYDDFVDLLNEKLSKDSAWN